jgi:serine/threonine protein phosphatase PrpC
MAYRAGSTATTAFLLDKGRRLIVANVGDSRAVLSRNGCAIELSVDHEPQKPEERKMVCFSHITHSVICNSRP